MTLPAHRELWIGPAGPPADPQKAMSAHGALSVDVPLADQSLFAANGMGVPDHPRSNMVQWLTPDSPAISTARAGWLVSTRVGFAHDHQLTAGTPTPGVKQISFVKRRADITLEEFDSRYKHHIEITKEHHAGVWQYAQSVVDRPLSPGAPPIDGISELWFQSEDDFVNRFYSGPDSPAAVREDTMGFIDFAGTFSVLVTDIQLGH